MRVQDTTHEVVRKQKEVGLNIVSDGEIGKLGPFYNRLENYGPQQFAPGEEPRGGGTSGRVAALPNFL